MKCRGEAWHGWALCRGKVTACEFFCHKMGWFDLIAKLVRRTR